MNSWTALAKLAAQTGPDARKHPRFKGNTIVVDHGEVLDFSATGLRIRFKRAPKYEVGITTELCLQCPRGEQRCLATVVRIKKLGWRGAEVGFRFANEEAAKQMGLFRAAWDPLADGMWSNR